MHWLTRAAPDALPGEAAQLAGEPVRSRLVQRRTRYPAEVARRMSVRHELRTC